MERELPACALGGAGKMACVPLKNMERSPHPHNRLQCLLLVHFGIDLCDGRGTVAQDNSGRFEAKLFTQERGGVVAKLVRVLVMLFQPRLLLLLK